MHKSRASNKFVGGDDVPLILLDFLKNPKQTVSWKKKDKIWKKSLCINFFFQKQGHCWLPKCQWLPLCFGTFSERGCNGKTEVVWSIVHVYIVRPSDLIHSTMWLVYMVLYFRAAPTWAVYQIGCFFKNYYDYLCNISVIAGVLEWLL